MKADAMTGKKREELTLEQKFWIGTGTVIKGLKPLLLYLCIPALLMCVGMLLFGGRSAEDIADTSSNFYYTLGIIVTVIVLHRRSKKNGSTLWADTTLGYQELAWKRLLLLVGTGLGFALFCSAVITIIPFPESLIESYHNSSDGLRNGTDQLLAICSTILLAPVAEEIVFRGYMLGRFLSWFTEKEAIVLSAVIFALCHVSLLWMVYACFMGILLAWVSIREDNIAYSIALHIGFNVSVVPIKLINENEAWKSVVFGDSLRIALLGVAALGLGLLAFERYRREELL